MTILVTRVVAGAEAESFGAHGKLMATGQMVEQGDESDDQIKCDFDHWSFSAAGLDHGECGKKINRGACGANSQGKKQSQG
jgi:hypothetical protein